MNNINIFDIKDIEIESQVNDIVGWVTTTRNHGGLLFIEIRNYEYVIQAVTDKPDEFPQVKSQYLISLSGLLTKRTKENINKGQKYGDREIIISSLEIISTSKTLPFQIEDNLDVDEQIKLQYRYLDLRRNEMHKNIKMRSSVFLSIRNTMSKMKIDEIDTPTLIRSTPEGARDFVVPSRKHSSKFYALPQSPQMYKQLFMLSFFKSYYQIARCYRDEDSRKDRQPEFTQFDLELPFAEPTHIQNIIEQLLKNIFSECMDIDIAIPFQRITYENSILKYGTDKPDLRINSQIVDISNIFANTNIEIIKKVLSNNNTVNSFITNKVVSRKDIDQLDKDLKELGSNGLGWFVIKSNEISGPLTKLLTQEEKVEIIKLVPNDGTVFFQAGDPITVNQYLDYIMRELTIIQDKNEYKFVWIDQFPYFEVENDELIPSHHPFTSPENFEIFLEDPNNAKALHYDLVLNGIELGSGSKRIHDPIQQTQVLKKWGLTQEEINERFGWFIEALSYGSPPHAGIALGIDRLLSTMLNTESIRDVIPFPKTQTGYDPLSDSPSTLDKNALNEYGLNYKEEN